MKKLNILSFIFQQIMSSNRTSNLSAFLVKNFIESRLTISFNTLLQTDQQHSTAEIQHVH